MGNFYNESWALAHMLALSPDYRPGFGEFMKTIAAGTPSVQVLEKSYGKPLPVVEKHLLQYLRGGRFQAALFDLKLQKVTQELPASPASPFDVALTLAELSNRPGNEKQSRAAFERLIGDDPARPEPHAALGYLEWRSQRPEDACPYFRKAYELGSRSSTFLWDYGRLASSTDVAGAVSAVSSLLEAQPNRLEARLHLASLQLRLERPGDALATLAPVKKVGKDDAPRFFRTLAYAQMQNGNRTEALVSARRWLEYSPADEKEQAEKLVRYLDAPSSSPGTPARTSIIETGETAAPRLQRHKQEAPVRAPVEQETPVTEVVGEFLEFDCRPPFPRMIVRAAGRKFTFVINDPQTITVTGSGGGTVDLTCGAQTKKDTVRVEYAIPDPPQPGVDGVIRIIHFGQP